MRRLLVSGLLALASVALPDAVAPTAAQTPIQCVGFACEQNPPTATVSPAPQAFAGTAVTHALTVTIDWCDDSSLDPSGRMIRFNGARVDSLFTYTVLPMTQVCRSRAQSTGTVHLVDGPNTLYVEVRDQSQKATSQTVAYTYTRQTPPPDTLPLPAVYTMDVAAVGESGVQVGAGARGTALFLLRNTGNRVGTFTLSATCTGPVQGCVPGAPTVTLGRGGEQMVAVHFTGVAGTGQGGEPSLGGDVVDPPSPIVEELEEPGSGATVLGQVSLSAVWQGQSGVQDAASLPVGVAAVRAAGLAGDPREDGGTFSRSGCVTASAGLDGIYECGDLRLAHPLPETRALSKTYAPTLVYMSQHATPYVLAGATVTPSGGGTVLAQLSEPQGSQTVVRGTGSVPSWTAGQPRRVTVGFDASTVPTGLRRYTLNVHRESDVSLAEPLATRSGWVPVVNRINSPFGNGWWLAGLEQVVEVGDGTLLWVGGDGSTQRYRPASGVPNLFLGDAFARPDTLWKNPSDTTRYYERPLSGGARVQFDPSGRHRRTVNAVGIYTDFVWNAAGRLTHVWLPRTSAFTTGQAYVFTYDGTGRLSQVTAPGSRVTTVFNSAGRIDSIAAPDGSKVGFRYAGSTGRITDRYDERRVRTSWTYAAGGKITAATIHRTDGPAIVTQFAAQEAKGLTAAEPLTTLYTLLDGPRTDVVDHTHVQVSARGAPVWMRDALGRVTTLHREDPRWPALVTRVQYPNGREITSTYDDAGRTTSTTDWATQRNGRYATTLYEWDRKWSAPTRVTLPEGETQRTAYDPATGQRLWNQAGADSARRVRYTYYPLTSENAPGLVHSVTMPDGTEVVEYDARGNVSGIRDVAGFWTATDNDGIGRPIRTYTPVDSARAITRALVATHGAMHQVWYDAAGRDTLELTRGPARTYESPLTGQPQNIPHEEVRVRKVYEGGMLVRVDRWASPDSNQIGVIRTEWRHDDARRVVREVMAGAPHPTTQAATKDSSRTVYDAAGNVVRSYNRMGDSITTQYDALNRATRRITHGVTRSHQARPMGDSLWVFPFFVPNAQGAFETRNPGSTPLVIPADTAVLTYHITGGIETANNRDARIRREYAVNGALVAETQKIRSYAGNDTTSHVYRLEYESDLNGRRVQLRHPQNLIPAGQSWAVQTYTYKVGTGELERISDPLHQPYVWSYDPVGRLTSFTRNAVTERFTYDGFGRQTRRVEQSASAGVLFDDRFGYDARGKLTGVQTLDDQIQSEYTGIGSLHRTVRRSVSELGTADDEIYRNDGLANPLRSSQLSGSKGTLTYTTPPVETRHAYEHGTGRTLHTAVWSDGVANTSDSLRYDADGNRIRLYAWKPGPAVYDPITIPTFIELAESYYDAAGQLRVHDRRTCLFWANQCDAARTPMPNDRAAFEEYRYDALGRRVLVRSRQEFRCPQRCQSAVRRTVWDGSQVLWEISAPGWTGAGSALMERDTGFVVPVATSSFTTGPRLRDTVDYRTLDSIPQANLPTRGFYYGRVMYVHGPGIDAPLSLVRMEYSDSLRRPVQIFLHGDWRGRYAIGTFGPQDGYSAGRTTPPCKTITHNTDLQVLVPEPMYGQEPKAFSPRNSQWQHCIEVLWTAPHEYVTRAWKGRPTITGNPSWMGSLIGGMRDVSGMMYRRNRYYDPNTAQFTQEDPIGLAGGLNLYGFANGDPISYSDPYGLCASAAGDTIPEIGFCPYYKDQSVESVGLGPVEYLPTPGAVGNFLRRIGSPVVRRVVASEAGQAVVRRLHRPYIRKATREAVEQRAARAPDGRFLDANTQEPIDGPYDLGHVRGREFRRERAKAEAEGLTQKEFNDRMNNPDLYQVEHPRNNRSHRYEEP